MTSKDFVEEVSALRQQYNEDNQWFGFARGGPSWSRGNWEQFVMAAWKLYQKAGTNQLQSILLGDTKIRSDSALLLNFGLVSNTNTPQEQKDIDLVQQLIKERAKIASNPDAKEMQTPVELMGPGSILSAERWSPLLNDALMLGGIRASQTFYFALNVDEQEKWKRLENSANTSLPQEKAAQDLWLRFFNAVPRVLWENGNPRVFVRELLGLKRFGYQPVFSLYQLGFAPPPGSGNETFEGYLKFLNEVGLHLRNRKKIMETLSQFLFNNDTALAGVGA